MKLASSKGLSPRILLFTPQHYIGGMLYVASALLNYYLLKKLPYSVVVPVGALCYVWTMLISRFLLGEKIGKKKAAGIGLIIAGVVMVAI